MLERAGNESQVAAVLTHEIAHIAQRHGADRLTQGMVAKWGLGLLGALLGNTGGTDTARAAASGLTGGVLLTFTRTEEREADLVGSRILTSAGWSGRGMVELFELLGRESDRRSSADAFLSSHPRTEDRIERLAAHVARRRAGQHDSARYRGVKAHLSQVAPARPGDNR